MIPGFWKRHFLLVEGLLALLIAIGFGIWCYRFDGKAIVCPLLHGNRAMLYGTMASIFGSLLGFVITTTSIVLGFSTSDNLAIVRQSAHYPMLWKAFSKTTMALAITTLVALLCLLVDRDDAPVFWLVVLLVLFTVLSLLRISRTIWILEQIIMLVSKSSKKA
jgi:hypothetical protein